jgi:hypothetical protein
MVQKKTTTHESPMRDFRLSEPRDYISLLLDEMLFDELLKTVTRTIAKRNMKISEAVTPSQILSITLCYLDSIMLLKASDS